MSVLTELPLQLRDGEADNKLVKVSLTFTSGKCQEEIKEEDIS